MCLDIYGICEFIFLICIIFGEGLCYIYKRIQINIWEYFQNYIFEIFELQLYKRENLREKQGQNC